MSLLDALDSSSAARHGDARGQSSLDISRAERASASSSSALSGARRVQEKRPTGKSKNRGRVMDHNEAPAMKNGEAVLSKDNELSSLHRWTLEELQDEARKYGFRVSNDRALLRSQIEAVHSALKEKREAQAQGTMPSSSQSGSSLVLIDDDTIGAISIMSDDYDEFGEIGDLTAGLIAEEQAKQARTERSADSRHKAQSERLSITRAGSEDCGNLATLGSSSEENGDDDDDNDDERCEDDDDDDDESEADIEGVAHTSATALRKPRVPEPSMGRVPAHVAKQLHDAILGDKDLYARILLFEPIPFDEISSTAKRAGVTGLRSKETLRNWLDVQCICFYSTELTGQRQRY